MDTKKIILFISKRRKELGLSQNDVASKIGYSSQLIFNWEKGKSLPDISILSELCKVLDISLEDLFSCRVSKKNEEEIKPFDIDSFSKGLRLFRNDHKLTQQKFARKVRVSYPTVIAWEKGKSTPSLKDFISICKLYSLKPSKLYYGEIEIDYEYKKKKRTIFATASGSGAVVCLIAIVIPVAVKFNSMNLDDIITLPSSSATSIPTTEPGTSIPTSIPTSEPTTLSTSESTSQSTSEYFSESTSVPTSEPTSFSTSEPTSSSMSEPTSTPTSEPTSSSTSESTSTPTSEPTSQIPSSSSSSSPTSESSSSMPTSQSSSDIPTTTSTSTSSGGSTSLIPTEGVTYTTEAAGIDEVNLVSCENLEGKEEVTLPNYIDGKKVVGVNTSLFNKSETIKKIVIPEGIVKFEIRCFYSLPNLEEIIFPNEVQYIRDYAFKGNTSLTKVTLPKKISSLGSEAFSGCTSLKEIDVSGVTMLNPKLFYGCTNLETITGLEKVKDLGSNFANGTAIKSLTFTSRNMSISSGAFDGMKELNKLDIQGAIYCLNENEFKNCNKLEYIIFPKDIDIWYASNKIINGDFKTTYYRGSKEDFASISFEGEYIYGLVENKNVYFYNETPSEQSWHYVDQIPTKY